MMLLTKELERKLLANGKAQNAVRGTDQVMDFEPVVKLFYPAGSATWLLTELDPENPTIAFGLCDLGMGFPELGYVDLDELRSFRGRAGLSIERDLWFRAKGPLSQYAEAASVHGSIMSAEMAVSRQPREGEPCAGSP